MTDTKYEPDETHIAAVNDILIQSRKFTLELSTQRAVLLPQDDTTGMPLHIKITSIDRVRRGESENGDPTLALTVVLSSGEKSTLILSFLQQDGKTRRAERDRIYMDLHKAVSVARRNEEEDTLIRLGEDILEPEERSDTLRQKTRVHSHTGEEVLVYCPFCGTKIYEKVKFCPTCGKNIAFVLFLGLDKELRLSDFAVRDALHHEESGEFNESEEREERKLDISPDTDIRMPVTEMPDEKYTLMDRFRGFHRSPAITFIRCRSDRILTGLGYFIICAALFSIINAISAIILIPKYFGTSEAAAMILSQESAMTFASIAGGLFILIFAGMILGGAVIHLGTAIAGGREGIGATYKSLLYAATPLASIGLIPGIGILIAPIWSFILLVLGIMKMQRLSALRALFGALFPFILGALVTVAITLSGTRMP